jgi:hypothetical protein
MRWLRGFVAPERDVLTFIILEHAVALAVVGVWAVHLRQQRAHERAERLAARPVSPRRSDAPRTDTSSATDEAPPDT